MATERRPRGGSKRIDMSDPATVDPATQAETMGRAVWRRYGWIVALLVACGSAVGWAVPRLIDYGASKQADVDDRAATRADIDGLKGDVSELRGEVGALSHDVHAALADRFIIPRPRGGPATVSP